MPVTTTRLVRRVLFFVRDNRGQALRQESRKKSRNALS